MRAYIIRRLLLIIPTLLLVTMMVFLFMRLIPGDVIDLMAAQVGPEQAVGTEHEVSAASIRHMLGLDAPIHVQYGRWMWNIITRGDFGDSLWTGAPVTEEIISRLPITFELGLLAIVVGVLIALPVGVYSAIRQDSMGDYLGRSFAIASISIPSFWLGTMIMVFPSVWWDWSPPMQYIPFVDNPLGNLQQFIIPAICLGLILQGITMRMTRTMMLEVLRQDFIRTAWSKGLTERTVILRHALKNALIPVVTIVGLQMHFVIGGSVIVEQIFNLPGVGRLALDALNKRDYTIVSGINLFIASFVMLIVLITDLTYAWLDPRVQYK